MVVTNVPAERSSVTAAWRNRARDLGVYVQWEAWRNPVQQGRLGTFQQALLKLRSLGLAPPERLHHSKPFTPWLCVGPTCKLCVLRPDLPLAVGRRGGGWRSWSLPFMSGWWRITSRWLLIRRCCVPGCDRGTQWPPEPAKWRNAVRPGLLCNLSASQAWQSVFGTLAWPEATSSKPALILFWRLAVRRSEFAGLENGIVPVDFRRWAGGATHQASWRECSSGGRSGGPELQKPLVAVLVVPCAACWKNNQPQPWSVCGGPASWFDCNPQGWEAT